MTELVTPRFRLGTIRLPEERSLALGPGEFELSFTNSTARFLPITLTIALKAFPH